MKIRVPGKLILSGEHAVVYGNPALAMAINRYAIATAVPQDLPYISYQLPNLSYERQFTFSMLEHLKNRIKNKYKRFIRGELTIRDVLQKPVELAQFALSLFFETLNIKLSKGIKIHMQSDIPIGCGMGSSAATILCIVKAIAHHLHIDLSSEMFYRLGLEAENMQHGYSSGLDLKVMLEGGCIYIDKGQMHKRSLPTLPLFLVNTGLPESSTGECVTAVAHHFNSDKTKNQFACVTKAMDKAFQCNDTHSIKQTITDNHQLLVKIGVVPDIVQNFITDIQLSGGAGKICGAGTISGQKAGIAVVITDNTDALRALCDQYCYTLLPITGESRGVHVV